MEMLILGLETPAAEDCYPRKSNPATALALLGLALSVFGITVLALLRAVPAPYKGLDYMVIGTVSVMAALLAVFLVLMWKTHFCIARPDPARRLPTVN